jgi:hypothetical protein
VATQRAGAAVASTASRAHTPHALRVMSVSRAAAEPADPAAPRTLEEGDADRDVDINMDPVEEQDELEAAVAATPVLAAAPFAVRFETREGDDRVVEVHPASCMCCEFEELDAAFQEEVRCTQVIACSAACMACMRAAPHFIRLHRHHILLHTRFDRF